jgi:hypothetical protein
MWDEVMEETKKDPSLQTKENKIIWWKKWKNRIVTFSKEKMDAT